MARKTSEGQVYALFEVELWSALRKCPPAMAMVTALAVSTIRKTFVAILKAEISWLSVHCPSLSPLERLERALAEADRVDHRLRVTAGRYVTTRHYSADVFVAMPRGQPRTGTVAKKLSVST